MENNYLINLREVGQRIKNARRRRNLTQEQAAEMASLTAQYWSLVENGQRASIHAYLQIAAVLGVTLNDLFYEAGYHEKAARPFSYNKFMSECTAVERRLADETLAWLETVFIRFRKEYRNGQTYPQPHRQ